MKVHVTMLTNNVPLPSLQGIFENALHISNYILLPYAYYIFTLQLILYKNYKTYKNYIM